MKRSTTTINIKTWFFLHLVVFFYIYSVQFTLVPFGLGTRVLLSFFGLVLFLKNIINSETPQKINKTFIFLFIYLLLISVVSFVSLVYNNTTDYQFIKYPISIFFIISSAYFLVNLVNENRGSNILETTIIKLIINVVFIQVILSLIMFLFPPFGEILNSLIVSTDQELIVLGETLQFRLVGFGSRFFGAGIVNGFALMLIVSLIRFNDLNKNEVFRYSFMFLMIFVLGMMMSRTTLIGGLLSLIILTLPKRIYKVGSYKKTIYFLGFSLLIPILLTIIIVSFFPEFLTILELALNFGFELFINYFEGGTLETESTNVLEEMLVLPDSIKTYIIGDGYYTDPLVPSEYYKRTDIGYLRLIYYFGLVGLTIYFVIQTYVIKKAYKLSSKYKMLFIFLALYLFILNVKGFTDLLFIVVLFCFSFTKKMNIK